MQRAEDHLINIINSIFNYAKRRWLHPEEIFFLLIFANDKRTNVLKAAPQTVQGKRNSLLKLYCYHLLIFRIKLQTTN